MAAAARGHEMLVALLVEAGARPYQRDEEGRTALDLARRAGHRDVVRRLESETIAAGLAGFF